MDNFDLKKFLKESKALENLNPLLRKENISENTLRDKIREMILTELGGGEDYDLEDRKQKYGINPEIEPEEDEDYSDYFFDIDTPEEDLEEAKKKKDKEETEDIEVTDTTKETPVEDAPVEDIPTGDMSAGGGLEDIAADMEGTEGELMDALMKALQIAKGMNNEKLETQVGNTLKFFVSEYIGGEENK